MRTSKRNALISLIPIYGLTSYFYLGWKYGLIPFFLNLFASIFVLSLPSLFAKASSEPLLLGISVISAYPLMFTIQFLLVRHYTVKRNMVTNK